MGLYDWNFDQNELERLYDRDLERMKAQAQYELDWYKQFQKKALEDMREQHELDVQHEGQWFHDEIAKIRSSHEDELKAHGQTKAALDHVHGKHTTASQITDHLTQKVNQIYDQRSQ